MFAEGVRYFLNGNSSWALLGGFNGVIKDKEDINLSNHKVAFHGNANNDMRSKILFDRAGIEVVATRVNSYDFVGNILGLNTLSPRKLIGSAFYLPHVFGGSVAQSSHTLSQTQKDWADNMTNESGKGRSILQKGFESVNDTVQSTVSYNSFLKQTNFFYILLLVTIIVLSMAQLFSSSKKNKEYPSPQITIYL